MDMKLTKRGEVWYIRINENIKKSLKTGNKKEAQKLFNEIQKREIQKKLLILDKGTRLSISEFAQIYTRDPDRTTLSDETLRVDKVVFKLLLEALGDIPIKLIDKESIKKFKSVSMKRVKPVSVNTYLRHIKAGLNWAKDEGYLDKVPKIKRSKVGATLPRYLYPDEVKKILEYTGSTKPEMHRIIKFALYTGCRNNEIIKARYEHIHENSITIYGKGDKERNIPLLPQALKEHSNVLQINGKNEKLTGKIFSYESKFTISHYFNKIVTACGITARFHDLRHTAATQMLSSGIDPATIQKILGHTDLKTTMVYAKVLQESIEKQMQKLSYE